MSGAIVFIVLVGLIVVLFPHMVKNAATTSRLQKIQDLKDKYKFDKEFPTDPPIGINTKTGEIVLAYKQNECVLNINDITNYRHTWLDCNNSKGEYYTKDHALEITTNDVDRPFIKISIMKEDADNIKAIFDILRSKGVQN